ncbi:hypothetical protein JB92DRAFT_2837366 [Gautieria morchelliformis]|nr:hypothetical protein JB92DRAFT_2837366 [Gautieria morchelliformis]
MQSAHRARCAVRSSRQWPCFFAWQAESQYPNPSQVWIWTHCVWGRRVIGHFPCTVGTKSSSGEHRGLTLSFSLRSVQKDQKQLPSVWLCKMSKYALVCFLQKPILTDLRRLRQIELLEMMPAQPLFTGLEDSHF